MPNYWASAGITFLRWMGPQTTPFQVHKVDDRSWCSWVFWYDQEKLFVWRLRSLWIASWIQSHPLGPRGSNAPRLGETSPRPALAAISTHFTNTVIAPFLTPFSPRSVPPKATVNPCKGQVQSANRWGFANRRRPFLGWLQGFCPPIGQVSLASMSKSYIGNSRWWTGRGCAGRGNLGGYPYDLPGLVGKFPRLGDFNVLAMQVFWIIIILIWSHMSIMMLWRESVFLRV